MFVCGPIQQQLVLSSLTGQLTIREQELSAVTEERDNVRRDMSESHLAKDEIVKRAWELRDQAVQRKNKAELEVARTRIDMMQVNSQLMEAVQQKIQLSQQLEQWQVSYFYYISSVHPCQNSVESEGFWVRINANFLPYLLPPSQVDMQQLLDEQMRTKLSRENRDPLPVLTENLPNTSQFERKRNRLFAIFRNFNS